MDHIRRIQLSIRLRVRYAAAVRLGSVSFIALAVVGCARGAAPDNNRTNDGPGGGDDEDASVEPHHDAPPQMHDGPDIDAPAPPKAKHVLLSEVMLGPAGGEFIEIVNGTDQAVDLSNYFLSDSGTYWKLPLGAAQAVTVNSDFVAQFKPGTSIPSGGVVVVALGTATAFQNVTGVAPTYSLADGTITHLDASTQVTLTDAGEFIVLFKWDGSSMLVQDVDMLLAGIPGGANGLSSKSAAAQGGMTYKTDLNSIAAQAHTPSAGLSTKRVAIEDGHETQDGTGNGLGGDDETSEDTSVTWDSTFTAPTPGQVPTALLP